ncbi:hypothetical protein P4O66_001807 [Electrophorus voltai]|uniref:BMP-2-inducible protein kinase C-terminal domain-containing protein n=1 Tax=Electrophorus voltai TaxID=2609070 RepID=A0AAD8Z3Y0_9TELE|nr:hypothetical protein P4O66_001807 [Electrophorus voltai]
MRHPDTHGPDVHTMEQSNTEAPSATAGLAVLEEDVQLPAKEDEPAKKCTSPGLEPRKPGEESDSDFESDPPSPKSSEDEEVEEDEGLNSEHEDTEPENLGQRPLLMDSEEEVEEEEDKHSSDSECDQRKARGRLPGDEALTVGKRTARGDAGASVITPPAPPAAALPGASNIDVFGAVPFGSGQPKAVPESLDVFAQAPFRQASQENTTEEFDVFTKAPFSRNLSKSSKSGDPSSGQTPPVSPASVDVFGFTPFQPSHAGPASRSQEDLFSQASFDEAQSPQQQRAKQRSLQKLSSRQRRTKQEANGANGKRHHSTPTSGRKSNKPSFRTPERARRHKKAGRRDSQSSNEFLSASKENISITPMGEVKDKGTALSSEEPLLDPFGAKPFHPQDGVRHGQLPGMGDNKSDLHSASSRSRTGSLHATFDGNKMDDFGAVPFTELVIQEGR